MSSKLLDRLLFIQGHCCFFCDEPLQREVASIEHLLAKSRDGTNEVDNCVACCQALNTLFDDMTVKEKMDVVLRQRGTFRCPRAQACATTATQPATPAPASGTELSDELLDASITYLKKYGARRPRSLPGLLDVMTARFEKQLDGAQVQALIDNLRVIGVVVVEHDGIVSYPSLKKTA